MIIKLLFFGITSDLIGEHSLNFDIEENLDVFALKKILITKYPVLKNIHEFAIAVNENYAEDELILKNGDIVAIIPPVSGG
jgi:molybdopterin converting factor subunit 1